MIYLNSVELPVKVIDYVQVNFIVLNFVYSIQLQESYVNSTMNFQTLKCNASTNGTASWNRNPFACVPINCKNPAPELPNLATQKLLYNPNVTTSRQYQTTVLYSCPANSTLPEMLSSNFSFDYSLSAGFIQNVTAVCDLDG